MWRLIALLLAFLSWALPLWAWEEIQRAKREQEWRMEEPEQRPAKRREPSVIVRALPATHHQQQAALPLPHPSRE